HCPFCHGYEVADQPTGIWNNGPEVAHQVQMLLNWSRQLTGLRLADGRARPLPVLYARLPWQQASALPAQLGCEITEQVLVRTDASYRTTVPGVYAAGDCCVAPPQLALAIAAGNLAGAILSRELILGT
ncbi:MAG: hypothetical protein EOO36_22750, partial [Cytophagaceae bacterium]